MNRKFFLPFAILLIVLIIGLTYYFFFTAKENVSSEVSVTSSSTMLVSSTIRVPVTFYDDFHKSEINLSKTSSYIDPLNHETVSFESLPTANSSNPSYSVLVNGNITGEIAGVGIAMTSFSPNNSYFAFRVRTACGATCNTISMSVVDLKNSKLLNIYPPVRLNEKDANTAQYEDHIGIPIIDSYSWVPNGSLQINYFFIGTDPKTGVIYRISPRQLWNYDLVTSKYTFVQTLPE